MKTSIQARTLDNDCIFWYDEDFGDLVSCNFKTETLSEANYYAFFVESNGRLP